MPYHTIAVDLILLHLKLTTNDKLYALSLTLERKQIRMSETVDSPKEWSFCDRNYFWKAWKKEIYG